VFNMWEFLTGTFMQRVVIFGGIGAVLSTADIFYDDFRLWAIIIFAWLLEYIAHNEGMHQGVNNMLNLSLMQLSKLKTMMDSVEQGNDHSEEEINNIINKEDDNEHK